MNLPSDPDHYPRLRLMLEKRWRFKPNWPILIALAILVLLLLLTGLPFLLPLGGPSSVDPESLIDPNGAFVMLKNGERLYYVHEPPSGPPGGPHGGDTIVLLHGFGGSTVTWAETIPVLAEAGYNVYALDLRGFGLSDKGWEANYSRDAQTVRLIAFMDALNINRAVLVGHSMGGGVAVAAALAHPERVSKLVLVDGAVLGESSFAVPDFLLKLPFTRRWAQFAIRRAVTPDLTADLLTDAAANDAAITPQLIDLYQRVLATPGWDLALLAMVRDTRRNHPLPVSDLRVPTLIVWGEQDTWVSPADGAELERLIPGARRVVLPNVGHLPMHEAPSDFQAALVDFLRE